MGLIACASRAFFGAPRLDLSELASEHTYERLTRRSVVNQPREEEELASNFTLIKLICKSIYLRKLSLGEEFVFVYVAGTSRQRLFKLVVNRLDKAECAVYIQEEIKIYILIVFEGILEE